jgi:acyl-CoA thioester hydrolase
VIETNVKYRAPARHDDVLTVETTISEFASVSILFDTKIFNQHGVLLVEARTKAACINNAGKAVRIPKEMVDKL